MKSVVVGYFALCILVATGSDLIIPRTCTEQIESESLNVGAVAYRLSADGDAADIVIGGENGKKIQVIDRTGIHGYRERDVADTDFVVTHSEGIIFDVKTDKYRVNTADSSQFGVTNWVRCTIPLGRPIGSVSYELTNTRNDSFFPVPIGETSERIDGNVWTMKLVWNDSASGVPVSGTLSVAKIKPKFLAVGSKTWINDLTSTEFTMRDTIGVLGLGHWREWAKGYIDKSDYTHWAKSPATNNVMMSGKSIIFDSKRRYQMYASSSSNLVIQAGGIKGMEFDFHGVPLSGALQFTDFKYEKGVATFTYLQDIDGFDLSRLEVQEADSFELPITWHTVPSGRIMYLTDHSFQVIGISGTQKFYRMIYDGEQTAVLTVIIRGQLTVTGDIGFNGTTLTHELESLRAELVAATNALWKAIGNN